MSDNKPMIKISNEQWLEAGMRKGYIAPDADGKPQLQKEALAFLPALGIGAAVPALWEGGKWLWNKATGNRSIGELFRGYNITPQQFMQIQKSYQNMLKTMDELAVMSPRVAQAVQAAKVEMAEKMNDMARQVGVAGGTAALRGQQMREEEDAAHAKKVEEMNKQLAMQQALGKGPGGELPKDFKVQAPVAAAPASAKPAGA